jgi:lysophospholipase L1-like esterase
LKSAAGPDVRFVGLEYADPYIAKYLQGAVGQADAAKTVATINLLDQTLDQAYKAAGMSVANVPGLFLSDHTAPVKLSGVGTVPVEVARVCEWTWMCKTKPWGPDDHPNNAGYVAIADAIVAALPSRW